MLDVANLKWLKVSLVECRWVEIAPTSSANRHFFICGLVATPPQHFSLYLTFISEQQGCADDIWVIRNRSQAIVSIARPFIIRVTTYRQQCPLEVAWASLEAQQRWLVGKWAEGMGSSSPKEYRPLGCTSFCFLPSNASTNYFAHSSADGLHVLRLAVSRVHV